MQTLLFLSGLVLFLIGLLTGLRVPFLANARMGLASHVEAAMNGMLLVLLGLLWPFVDVNLLWELIAVSLLIYGAYANWLATLLAAMWGAGGPMMPLAAPDRTGSPSQEAVIRFLLSTLSLADIAGILIVIVGVARG